MPRSFVGATSPELICVSVSFDLCLQDMDEMFARNIVRLGGRYWHRKKKSWGTDSVFVLCALSRLKEKVMVAFAVVMGDDCIGGDLALDF